MADESVAHNLERMDELDFAGWNGADWEGVFTRYHTDDVLVDVHGQAPTHGIREHIQAMKAFVESTGGAPVTAHGAVDSCPRRAHLARDLSPSRPTHQY